MSGDAAPAPAQDPALDIRVVDSAGRVHEAQRALERGPVHRGTDAPDIQTGGRQRDSRVRGTDMPYGRGTRTHFSLQ